MDREAAAVTSPECSTSRQGYVASGLCSSEEGGSCITGGTEQTSERESSSSKGANTGSSENGGEIYPQSREDRRIRRVMANRRSARESRDRRKQLLSDLQVAVQKVTEENRKIAQANLAMRRELIALLQESGLPTVPTSLSI